MWAAGMLEATRSGLTVKIRQGGAIPLDLAFTCRPGEMVALIGPSGAGKTTILRTIAGLYRPAFGQIIGEGEASLATEPSIQSPPHQRRVGLVFQSYALFPHMTALGNVEAAMTGRPAGGRGGRGPDLLH